MTLKCIAVDDEPLALGLLCSFIEQTPFLKLIGKFSNAVEALRAVHENQIDLIFLDIRMPDLSGIELARILDKGNVIDRAGIIFTTAFDQFAVEGYKVNAIDYLLKPFNYVDFSKAANKALTHFELLHSAEDRKNLNNSGKQDEEYLFLKVEYQLVKVALKDIIYIEGLKDYVKIHLAGEAKPLLSLISLKLMEEKLPVRKFLRIHRSYIVSLERIKSVTKNSVNIASINIVITDQYKEAFAGFLIRWV